MSMNDTRWVRYEELQPTEKGVYEWRVPSVSLPNVRVTFQAWMRQRNAGFAQVLSPAFDYWDGWKLTLPAGISWRAIPAQPELKEYDYAALGIEGLDFCQCPYCCKIPKLHGWQYASGGGLVVAADPFRYNAWQLKCCAWGKTPTLPDPREIEKIRRDAFARARGAACPCRMAGE